MLLDQPCRGWKSSWPRRSSASTSAMLVQARLHFAERDAERAAELQRRYCEIMSCPADSDAYRCLAVFEQSRVEPTQPLPRVKFFQACSRQRPDGIAALALPSEGPELKRVGARSEICRLAVIDTSPRQARIFAPVERHRCRARRVHGRCLHHDAAPCSVRSRPGVRAQASDISAFDRFDPHRRSRVVRRRPRRIAAYTDTFCTRSFRIIRPDGAVEWIEARAAPR
jgi:PAS domain-containing protein